MDRLIVLDRNLFRWLNLELTHPLLDVLMPWVTDLGNFFIPLVLAGLGLFIFGGNKGRKVFLLTVLVLMITDQSSSWLKDQIQRIRPCNIEDVVNVFVGCTHSFSMPSSHAANIVGTSVILSSFYRRLTPFFILVASLVAYSRIYVGVHYPSDVLAGITLGLFWSFLVMRLEKELTKLIKVKNLDAQR